MLGLTENQMTSIQFDTNAIIIICYHYFIDN
jgi:hypothetical protein